MDPAEDFFDPSFLAELEELASSHAGAAAPQSISQALHDKLAQFLSPLPGSDHPLTEEEFLALPQPELSARTNDLLDMCRSGGKLDAGRAVESFIVFFQALVPTLPDDGSREIRRFFFRLVPTLIHIAFNDFSDVDDRRDDGRKALSALETVLIEISSVRLAPSESDLVFRSIDQMAAFIGVGEYAMASGIISSQLLSIIERNKLMRYLFRLMEVEANVQVYLKERLGYTTPQLKVPDDFERLREYGPLRILREQHLGGQERWFIQFQIPHIPILRDVVMHLAAKDGEGEDADVRLDAIGSAELAVPPGMYGIGLAYAPQETR